jgi:hypothetical protein
MGSRIPRQQGAAALAVTLVLLFISTLVAAYAHRNHLFELSASTNQYRTTQAFEAAEAGLEWAIALLNDPRPIDPACVAGSPGDTSFRERHAVAASPPAAACVREGSAWRCDCPPSGQPLVAESQDQEPAPAFRVQVHAGPSTGLWRLAATGCSRRAGACAPGEGTSAEATARLQVDLAFVPSPAAPPVAPLTVRGNVDAGGASLGLHNTDADTGGIVVHAGGIVAAANARTSTSPGSPVQLAFVELDSRLAAPEPDRLFASIFGIDKALWREQPGVAHIACDGDCGEPVRAAIAPGQGRRLLWVEGDLELSGAVTLGAPDRPVVLVAAGAVRLSGPVAIYGLLYGRDIRWTGAGGGMLRGAAVSEGGYTGDAAPDFTYDAGVLAELRRSAGSFARVPGSWRDF